MQAGDRTHIEEVESAQSPVRNKEAERTQVHQALQCVRPGRASEAEQRTRRRTRMPHIWMEWQVKKGVGHIAALQLARSLTRKSPRDGTHREYA
eukprot:scaffold16306_cov66-Phaeocystis_antarctica.AAC.1